MRYVVFVSNCVIITYGRLLEAIIITIFTTILTYVVSSVLPCRNVNDIHPPATMDVCDKESSVNYVRMFCPSGYYSGIL